MKRPSSTRQATYAWMARVAQLRKWVSERTINAISSYSYTLVNDDYELTQEVDRNDILDDEYGVYNPLVEDMGRAAAKWPDSQLATVMINGQASLCYDGQNFFDAAHPIDKYKPSLGTQQNYWSSGKALTPDNAMYLRAQMMGWKGEDGTPFGINPRLLIVDPSNEQAAMQICNGTSIAPATWGGQTQVGANDNTIRSLFNYVVVPELAAEAGAWYLVDNSRGSMMPFLFQLRQEPKFIQLTQPSDEPVWRRKKFVYAADARGAFGYGLWFLAAKAKA